jgi:hypothetical protein
MGVILTPKLAHLSHMFGITSQYWCSIGIDSELG